MWKVFRSGGGFIATRAQVKSTYLGAAFVAAIAAIVVRFYGLGRWALTRDEYYIAQAVRNVVEHGIPLWDCGGVYGRGLVLQYLTAPLYAAGLDPEWAVRFWPVVANLALLPALFLIGRRIGGLPVATAVTLLAAFSVWEVEFARFGRMYSMFQALITWQLYLLVRVIQDRDERPVPWMYGLGAVSPLVYEGGIFVIGIAIMPLALGYRRRRLIDVVIAGVLVAWAVYFDAIDLRTISGPPVLPPELRGGGGGSGAGLSVPLNLPPPLLAMATSSVLGSTAMGMLALGWFAFAASLIRARDLPVESRIVYILVAAAPILALFSLGLGLAVAAYLLGIVHFGQGGTSRREEGGGVERRIAARLVALWAVAGLYWSAFALFHEGWLERLGRPAVEGAARLVQLGIVLARYPEVLDRFFWLWLRTIPVVTVAIVCACAVSLVLLMLRRHARESRGAPPSALAVVLATVVLMVLLIGLIRTPYETTRYTFFLYPALLLCLVGGAWLVGERLPVSRSWHVGILALGLSALAFPAEDWDAEHLATIGSHETNFRLEGRRVLAGHYYPRNDYESVGDFLDANVTGDHIVLTFTPVIDFYMNEPPDWAYVDAGSSEFNGVSACEGTRERWSDSGLLYRPDQVDALIANASGTIWLVMNTERNYWRHGFVPAENRPWYEALRERVAPHAVFTSMDGSIQVFRLEPDASDADPSGA